MHVREVIPFGKSDEKMEMREGIKLNCGERGREADRQRNVFRGVRSLLSTVHHLYSPISQKVLAATYSHYSLYMYELTLFVCARSCGMNYTLQLIMYGPFDNITFVEA